MKTKQSVVAAIVLSGAVGLVSISVWSQETQGSGDNRIQCRPDRVYRMYLESTNWGRQSYPRVI